MCSKAKIKVPKHEGSTVFMMYFVRRRLTVNRRLCFKLSFCNDVIHFNCLKIPVIPANLLSS